MRIVSQDKISDFDYENHGIFINSNNEVYSRNINLGTYATKERALEVMAEIRDTWVRETDNETAIYYEMPKRAGGQIE